MSTGTSQRGAVLLGLLGSPSIGRFALIGLFVLAILYTLAVARSFILPVVAAAVLALLLNPVARALKRIGIGSSVAAGLIVVTVIGLGVIGTASLAPAIKEWSDRLPVVVRQVERKLAPVKSSLEAVEEVTQRVEDATKLGNDTAEQPQTVVIENGGIFSTMALSAPGIVFQIALTTAVTFFFIMERNAIRRAIIATGQTFRWRLRFARICRDVRRNVGVFLFSATLINAGLGVLTGLLVHFAGIGNPVLWGVAMTVLNFVPFIGPLLVMLSLLLIGLVSFSTVAEALVAPGGLLLLNIAESQIVTPLVLGRRLLASPLMIFLAVGFGGWLWGVLGALIAVPILILAITVARHFARYGGTNGTLPKTVAANDVPPRSIASDTGNIGQRGSVR